MTFKNHEDQQAFEIWAFGFTPVKYTIGDMHCWNSRHGEKVWLESSETLIDSLKKMYELYLKELKEPFNDPTPSQD